jgi:hypothetical protein
VSNALFYSIFLRKQACTGLDAEQTDMKQNSGGLNHPIQPNLLIPHILIQQKDAPHHPGIKNHRIKESFDIYEPG